MDSFIQNHLETIKDFRVFLVEASSEISNSYM